MDAKLNRTIPHGLVLSIAIGTTAVILAVSIMLCWMIGARSACVDETECVSHLPITNDLDVAVSVEDCFEADCPTKGYLQQDSHEPYRISAHQTLHQFDYSRVNEVWLRFSIDGSSALRCAHVHWQLPSSDRYRIELPAAIVSHAVTCVNTERTSVFDS